MFCFHGGDLKASFLNTLPRSGPGLHTACVAWQGLQIGDGLCVSFGSDDPARGHARPSKWNSCIHPPETKGSQHTKEGAILGPLRTGSQLHKHRGTWSYNLGPLIFPQTPLNSSVFQQIRMQYQTLPKVLE